MRGGGTLREHMFTLPRRVPKKFACAPPHISNKESYPNAPRMAREIAVYAWLWVEACLFELDSVCSCMLAEYWWFMLGCFILYFAASSLDILLGRIVIMMLFLPMLAVTVRRYHDVGLSGWWGVALWLLSMWWIGGLIIMLGIAMIVGKKGPNKYGTATLPPA